jgi:hypothetical protein
MGFSHAGQEGFARAKIAIIAKFNNKKSLQPTLLRPIAGTNMNTVCATILLTLYHQFFGIHLIAIAQVNQVDTVGAIAEVKYHLMVAFGHGAVLLYN